MDIKIKNSLVIGILQTGNSTENLRLQHGTYPEMFQSWLSHASPDYSFIVYPVLENVFPDNLDEADCWVITGSRSCSLEQKEWIDTLMACIRELHRMRKPLLGICFGHQIIARALGGVVTASVGWNVGLQQHLFIPNAHFPLEKTEFFLPVFHQDQVTTIPPSAQIIATKEGCPFAGLTYGKNILSLQGHPEMTTEFLRDLLHDRKAIFSQSEFEKFANTLTQPNDGKIFALLCMDFIQRNLPA